MSYNDFADINNDQLDMLCKHMGDYRGSQGFNAKISYSDICDGRLFRRASRPQPRP